MLRPVHHTTNRAASTSDMSGGTGERHHHTRAQKGKESQGSSQRAESEVIGGRSQLLSYSGIAFLRARRSEGVLKILFAITVAEVARKKFGEEEEVGGGGSHLGKGWGNGQPGVPWDSVCQEGREPAQTSTRRFPPKKKTVIENVA